MIRTKRKSVKFRKSRVKQNIDWDRRYPDNWRSRIRPACLKSTCYLCSRCWFRKAEQVHHMRYRFLFLRPRRWAIGIFLVPLCLNCHIPIAHHRNNWIEDQHNPLWKNRNTFGFGLNLIVRYWLLRLILLIRGV